MRSLEESLVGCILGTAVGDALGLPCEALSKRRQRRMFPQTDRYHFVFGRGMTSDDTEHTCLVAQALIVSGGDAAAFTKSLAWRLRWWLLGLPANIGMATLRAGVKLWLGFGGSRSGVFSAGNGPAMRSAVIGASFGSDLKQMCQLVRSATRITHTDPKAEFGALAVALAASLSSRRPACDVSADGFLDQLTQLIGADGKEFLDLIRRVIESAAAGQTTEAFAAELGLEKGVSGYVYHTVPVSLHAWFAHQADFSSAVTEVIRCGGDADTTAAIVGGLVGARTGKAGIPQAWLDGLWEWPRTVAWMESLAARLASVSTERSPQPELQLFVPGVFLRNILFLLVVLAHGFRRMLPPY